MAQKGLRTICLAYKDVNEYDDFERKDAKGIFDIEID